VAGVMRSSRQDFASGALTRQSFRQPGTPAGCRCADRCGAGQRSRWRGPIAQAVPWLLTKVKSADIPDPPIAIGDTLPE